jgi:hypothetical protein
MSGGAIVAVSADFHGEELAVTVERKRRIDNIVARVVIADEAGTVGSLSAGVNAIVDALSVLGIKHVDTPCTPYGVWQAIANAGARVTKPRTS